MRIKYFHIIVFALLLVALNSCYSYRQVGLLQEREDLPQYDSIAYEPYRLQVNDEIVYRVITMDQTIAKTLSTNNTRGERYLACSNARNYTRCRCEIINV